MSEYIKVCKYKCITLDQISHFDSKMISSMKGIIPHLYWGKKLKFLQFYWRRCL